MLALALRQYEHDYNSLPPAYTTDASGQPLHSWRALILPYIEQKPLYDSIDFTKPWNDPANSTALNITINTFHCPESNAPRNTTTYFAIVGPNNGLLPNQPGPLSDITDSRNKTLMLIEAGEESAIPWMAPTDADEHLVLSLGPKTKFHHEGGMQAAYVDGSVRFLKADTPARVRQALMSISGNDDDIISE